MISAIAINGCGAPKGDSGGRVATHETTKAERGTGQMTTSDLATASDEVAEKFAAELAYMSEVDFKGKRVSIVFGDIANRSRTMPASDVELVRNRIRGKLMNSRSITEKVKFIEKRRRTQANNDEEYGRGGEDILDEGKGGGVGVERANPRDLYYLNADLDAVHRGTTHMFGVTFNLSRASDSELVLNKYYEVKYE